MNLEIIRQYCLRKDFAEETLPFDDVTPVYKVGGKMFLLASTESQPLSINIKCDPETAVDLRERYDSVIPGYHMNKKHWITVYLDQSIPDNLIFEWIDNSYSIVFEALSKKEKDRLRSEKK